MSCVEVLPANFATLPHAECRTMPDAFADPAEPFDFGRASEIVPGFLWLSGVQHVGRHIRDLNIGYVLNMADLGTDANAGTIGVDPYGGPLDDGVRYKGIDLYDHPTEAIDQHFDETYEFISKAKAEGARCLVHCVAGASRSAAIVIAYLVRANGWTLAQAFAHVQQARPCVQPNDGFMRQLSNYEHRLIADGLIAVRRPSRCRRDSAYDMSSSSYD